MRCLTVSPWGDALPGIWAVCKDNPDTGQSLHLMYEDIDGIFKELGTDLMSLAWTDRKEWKFGFLFIRELGPEKGTLVLLSMVNRRSRTIIEDQVDPQNAELIQDIISPTTRKRIGYLYWVFPGGSLHGPDWNITFEKTNEWAIRALGENYS